MAVAGGLLPRLAACAVRPQSLKDWLVLALREQRRQAISWEAVASEGAHGACTPRSACQLLKDGIRIVLRLPDKPFF